MHSGQATCVSDLSGDTLIPLVLRDHENAGSNHALFGSKHGLAVCGVSWNTEAAGECTLKGEVREYVLENFTLVNVDGEKRLSFSASGAIESSFDRKILVAAVVDKQIPKEYDKYAHLVAAAVQKSLIPHCREIVYAREMNSR